jgi:hypothetical protein
MALQGIEEGKLLSEALNTVKIQVQQMKRHLVTSPLFYPFSTFDEYVFCCLALRRN